MIGHHVKVDGVSPRNFSLGATTTILGQGDLDADQVGGTFKLTMKGVGGLNLLHDCEGDAAMKKVCEIGLGFDAAMKKVWIKLGTLTYWGFSFPVKAGHITGVQFELSLTGSLPPLAHSAAPAGFTYAETKLEVTSADGSDMICVDLKANKR